MISAYKFKVSLIILKYVPFLMAFIMWIHVYLLLIGCSYKFAELFVGCTVMPTIILIVMSDVMRFCWLHKCYIIYAVIVDYCINIHRNIGIWHVNGFRMLLFVLGLYLFTYTLIYKIEKYDDKAITNKDFKQ